MTGLPEPEMGPRSIDRHAARMGLGSAASRLVEVLDANEPMRVDELAAELDVHSNTVRTHLDQLLEKGLIRRRPHHDGGRGRPQWLYSSVPTGADQADLVRVLAHHIGESDDAAAGARKIGRHWGELIELNEADDPVDALIDALAELGFGPEHLLGDQGDELRLRTCPILEAARENTTVICNIHQGMLERMWADLRDEGCPGESEGADEPVLTPFAGPGWCTVEMPKRG